MSAAVKAVRYLLANNAGLLAVVTADQIMAGPLPQGIGAPAVSISHVSTVWRNPVKEPGGRLGTSRVQLTVLASSYPLLRSTLDLVRAALPRSRGTVNGVAVESILSDTEGPEFVDPETGTFEASIDFMVTFND